MARLESRLTRKGQVTLPIEVRRALGINEGDRISFVLENGSARLERRASVTDRTAGIFRSAQPALTTEQLRQAAEVAMANETIERSRS